MSYQHIHPSGIQQWLRPMQPRDPDEGHRASTPLELFFDLVFVVAVAQAANSLHHALLEGGSVGAPVGKYILVFFGIWWAWMNFSWFASAFDTEDIAYRLVVFVQMTGALIYAAGIPRAFQVGWIALLVVPGGWEVAGFIFLGACELLVPVWAERVGTTSWHASHITERYGLFTIIVLGESVLAGTVAIQTVLDEGGLDAELYGIIAGGLLLLFSMWWIYFDYQVPQLLTSNRIAFRWGYGHLLIFAAVAAVGAGLVVAVEHAAGHGHVSDVRAGMIVAVPVAVYLLALWLLHVLIGASDAVRSWYITPLTAVLVLLAALTPQPVLLIGLLVAAMMALKLVLRLRLTVRPAR